MGSPTSRPASQPDDLHCTSRGFTQSYLSITYSTMPYSGSSTAPHHQPPPATTTIRQVIGSINQGRIRPYLRFLTSATGSVVIRVFFSSNLVLAWLTSTLSRCPALHYLLVHLLPPRTYSTSTVPYRIKKPCGFFSHLASDEFDIYRHR